MSYRSAGGRLTITGVTEFNSNLQQLKTTTPNLAKNVIEASAKNILERTQNIMPVVTGALRDSGKVETEIRNGAVNGYIGFGDETLNPQRGMRTEEYAVAIHERDKGGKWLENTLYDYAPEFLTDLQQGLSVNYSLKTSAPKASKKF